MKCDSSLQPQHALSREEELSLQTSPAPGSVTLETPSTPGQDHRPSCLHRARGDCQDEELRSNAGAGWGCRGGVDTCREDVLCDQVTASQVTTLPT